jgi:SAM-dependent methyltransferase
VVNLQDVGLEQSKLVKLNLGCGNSVYDGYVNVDKKMLPGVDLVHDLERTPLPFSDNSVDIIRCEHVLEHVQNYLPLLEDMYRISKPCARIIVRVPYFKYEGAFRDPTHVRFFTEHSFDYFSDSCNYSYYSKIRFRIKKAEKIVRFLSSIPDIKKKIMPYIPFKRGFDLFFWNVYSEIYFELEVIK